MAKLKDGFYKQTAEAIGSDLHVLLAGGGSKALTDFAYKSDLTGFVTGGPYLPLSGGTITGTLKIYRDAAAINYCSSGGTSQGWLGFSKADTPTVWMANGSTSYNIIHSGNHNDSYHYRAQVINSSELSFSNSPKGIVYYDHYSGHTLGSYRGVLVANNGSVAFELNSYWCVNPTYAASANDLRFRVKRDAATDWGPYSKILTEHNYSTTLDTRYYTETEINNLLANYLSLAGGNMKNAAVVTFPANGTLRQTTATTSNATSIIEWYKGTTKDANYTHPAQIGWHNTGNTYGAIYLVPYPTNTDPWAGSVGLYIGKTALQWNNQGIIHSGNIGSQSVNYANSAGNADKLDNIDSTGFLRYYNSNTEPSNVNIVDTPSYVWTVSTTGGTVTTATKPSGMDNAWGVIHLHTHYGNYATQLGFGGTTGRMYMRNAYNTSTFGNWQALAFTSDIPSVGNGTVTITQAGTTIGSFTMNQSGNTTINLTDTDTNYYPVRYYTSGLQISTYSGSTDCSLYVPHATTSQAGVVNTTDQSFNGNKTFSKINSIDPGYLLFYAGRVYKKDGSTSASSIYGMSGFSISVTKLRAGAYQVKVTNTTGRSCYIHPMLYPVFANKGEGSCYEHGFAYFSSGDSYQFPVSLSTGVSITFTIICGYMHTQGSWSSGDFTKSNDGGGFTCEIFATWSY